MAVKIKDKDLYFVGGVVRDEMLDKPSFDTDFCYEGNAIEFSKKFNIIKTNPNFGTVRILLEGEEIDIASTRTETYPEVGHLPVVSNIGCSLKDDLSRRDFTINAMAKNTVTNEIIDYFNGQNDLKNKQLRVLHNKSFVEDPSRIIRGLKFSVRFDFELEDETKRLQEEYLSNINYDMSFHRIKKELKETFSLNSDTAYHKFIEQGIYKLLGENQVIPDITTSIQELVEIFKPKTIWLIYAGLFNLDKFELTSDEKFIIESYQKIKGNIPHNDIEIYNLFRKLPLESVILYTLTESKEIGLRYLNILVDITIQVNGDDLKLLGIKQGKIYQEIFNYITEQKINNPKATKKEELNWVKEKFL